MNPMNPIISHASGGRRFVAYLIDSIIMAIFTIILTFVVIMPDYLQASSDFINEYITGEQYITRIQEIMYSSKMMGVQLVTYVITFLYFVVAAYTLKGATLGKKLMGITIAQEDGSPIGFGKLFLREFLKVALNALSCGVISIISFILVLGESKRAVHDIIAKTVVIDTRSKIYY